MSLAEYKARFDSDVRLGDFSLEKFLLITIDEDPAYADDELRNACEQQIVLPFLQEKFAELPNEQLGKEIANQSCNHVFVEIISKANMWPELMRRVQSVISTMDFNCQQRMLVSSWDSDSWNAAILKWTSIVHDVYAAVFENAASPISDIEKSNRFRALDESDEKFGEVIELLAIHENDQILDFCSIKIQNILERNKQLMFDTRIVDILHKLELSEFKFLVSVACLIVSDMKNDHMPGVKSIIDVWVDVDLLGMRWEEKRIYKGGDSFPAVRMIGPNGAERPPAKLYVLSEEDSFI